MSVQAAAYPSGVIAGGMADGHLNVWDAHGIMNNSDNVDPLILQAEGHHVGSVTGLKFNPHEGWGHSLASGGSDGEVLSSDPGRSAVVPKLSAIFWRCSTVWVVSW